MQIERFFSSKLVAAVGSVVIAACLVFSPSPYDTARGFSAASVSTAVSNTASKGGSAYQQASVLCSRSCGTAADISKAQREDSNRM